MKKRYIAALLAAMMLSMTACGSSEEPAADEKTEADAAVPDTESGAAAEVEFYDTVTFDRLTSKVVNMVSYKGIETRKEVMEITEEDIQKEIDAIKKGYATLEDADHAAALGDVTVIDYTGYVDGETRDGMQDTEFSLELGSGTFIPGFEDQLVGASAGDDVDVQVTFPEDYHAPDLAGQDALFEVHVHKVQEYVNHDWNDAFIKENLGEESEDDLRSSIREEMEALAEEAADANVEYNLLMHVIENSEFQIEDEDVTAFTDEMMNQYISMGAQYGIPLQDVMTYLNTTEEEIRDAYKETAVFSVKMMLVLREIVEQEALEATDEECTDYMEVLAEEYNCTIEEVKAVYSESVLKEQLVQEKAIGVICDNAVIL